MIAIFVVFGFLTVALYISYSQRVGSFVNAISIFSGLKIVIEFVLEPLAYLLDMYSYNVSAMLAVYLLSFLGYAAFIAGLLVTKQAENLPRRFSRPNYLIVSWVVLAAAWILYAPVLIEFQEFIIDPRQIYEKTRNGYGFYTFGSSLLSFSAYIIFLMSSKKRAYLFYMPLLLLLLLKGAKGQFFVLLAIFIIAKVYLEGFRYSLTRSATYSVIAAIGVLYLFAFNYRGQINNIFVTIAGYSDYNRNAALVLEDNVQGAYGGQIFAETLWIPKVPRALWPEKPVVFGEFRLAARYYPQWFSKGTGSPSFGLGPYFADFGWGAFPFIIGMYFICGYWLGRCLNGLILRPNAFYFVMSVYLSGNNLLAIGSGAFIVEHAIVGLALSLLLGLFTTRVANTEIQDRSLAALR